PNHHVAVWAEGPAPFAPGQRISGQGIEPGTTITSVGKGTLGLSAPVEAGTGVSVEGVTLSAASDQVTDLRGGFSFQVGEPIDGEGIPAGTTVSAVSADSISLSAFVTQGGAGVHLLTEGPAPFQVGE